ncbi:uncharacterized protein LOC143266156 [Megachile rotundata]|uniref:uncharacterized protein LOC143266156 n=1 Tax=Megachile rotundata TaxID=143995 RepID=UPI003FD35E7C
MAPAVAELLQSQADLFTRIDNFKRNTDKLGKDNLTVTVLKSRQRLLNSYWEKFTNNHDAIVRLPESKATEYTAKGVYDQVEAQFVLRYSELSVLIAAAERANGTSASSGSSAAVHKYPEVVLPPITLPTFSGETLEWESFRDRFRSLIHDNDRLSELQKLQYLKGALRGEAARVVEATPTMEGCYAGAFESLERRFGNSRMLSAAHLRRLIHSKAISKATPQDFKRILDEFRGSRLALKALGRPVDHWNELFFHLLSEKLDTATRISWESSLDDPTRVPAFEDLEKYLETRVHALSFAQERDRSSPSVTVKDKKRPATVTPRERSALGVQVANEPTPKSKMGRVCPKCSGPHQLGFCPRFKAVNPLERRDFVDAHALCSSCLNPGHTTKSCKSSYRCMACQGTHHTLLHDAYLRNTTSSIGASGCPAGPSTSASTYAVRSHSKVLLATAQVRMTSPSGLSVSTGALLDPGSETSFVSERLAQTLRLKRKTVHVTLRGLDAQPLGEIHHEVRVWLTSDKDPAFQIRMEALVTRKVTSHTPSLPLDSACWDYLEGFPLADENFRVPSRVDALLGANVCGFLFLENRVGPPGVPPLARTPFGWAPLGPVQASSTTTRSDQSRILHVRRDDDLHTSLQRFWEIENVPTTAPLHPSEIQCKEHFSNTHSKDGTGRYVVRLPFSSQPTEDVGVTRVTATRMLLASERRRERDPRLRERYAAFLDEYLKLGHMEPVTETSRISPRCSYLPHHGVWKGDGDDAKIRVVFDASCVSTGRSSLNSVLLPGPKLQSELWMVLTRWRLFRCAFSADIVKMFRQIRVHPEDRDWQRIVWRPSPTEEVRDFRLTTITYATTPAPFLALRVLQQLADDEGERFPRGAEELRCHSYVDDILAGADNVQEAEEVRHQLVELLTADGFPLDKWAVNFDTAMFGNLSTEKLLQVNDTVGALGLRWDPKADILTLRSYRPVEETSTTSWTKREVVSETARLFDPMGWFAPVLIRAKVLTQDLWLAALDWDEPLTKTIDTNWANFRCDLERLEALKIPRWTGSESEDALELHAFCDASERAYAAAIYLRVPHSHTAADVHLLVCKTKVAPTKQQSVPRLELCGVTCVAPRTCFAVEAFRGPPSRGDPWSSPRGAVEACADF